MIEIIWLGRIEVLPVCTEILHDRQIELFHAHHHHLSHLVGTVWIEVGVILQSLSLVGISICRIVNQRLLAVLITQSLEEGTGHIVEFDDRNILSLSHSSHGIRIILMSLLNLAMGSLIEEATLGRSYEDDVATLLAYLVDEFLQIIREVIPGTTARILLLLVIMTELTNHIVALLHHRQHLVQTVGSKEGTCCQSAFGMV